MSVIEQPRRIEQRIQWRAAYRLALETLNRMYLACQPLAACAAQAQIVQQLRADIASTFHPRDLVMVLVNGTWSSGTYLGPSYQGVCVYLLHSGDGILVTVDADLVYGVAEPLPDKGIA